MDLSTWASRFGKSAAVGGNLLLFDNINYHGLDFNAAYDINKLVSGLPLLANKKHQSYQELGGQIIIITANNPFS